MKKNKAIILGLCLLAVFLAFAGCGQSVDVDSQVTAGDHLEVHVIDVGQADAILVRTPDEGDWLIDGGTGETEDDLIAYLERQGVKRLEYVVATHPHEDHIGGLDKVIQTFDIGTVYMPKVSHTTKAFENMLLAIQKKDIPVVEAKADVRMPLGNGTQGLFLAPCSEEYESLNDYSAVLKVVYGNTSFLLTGDAEKLSEAEMLSRYSSKTLASTVLKVGHHGSKTSTSEEFLQAVQPKGAAISVGQGNDYGLPHGDTLKLLEQNHIPYWRTDEDGSLVFYSDGENVRYGSEQMAGDAQTIDTPDASASAQSAIVIESVDRVREIAVLINTQTETVDLSGWVLVSVKGDQRYTFPEGTILAGGARLSVVSGENGAAGENQLFWTNQNIWNNQYDPAKLYDAGGNLVDEKEE